MALAFPDPPLYDDAIVLRSWSMADVPDLVRFCNDAEIHRWLSSMPAPYTEDDAIEFVASVDDRLRDGIVRFALADARTDALCGGLGVRIVADGVAQTGYWVAPGARGRGVASRAAILASRWALRTLSIARLQLFTDVDNLASMRVAERAGFVREGVLRNWHDNRGERRDVVMFSLVPQDVG
jgi:RimJ/RimL family protein N-acetyltransferase